MSSLLGFVSIGGKCYFFDPIIKKIITLKIYLLTKTFFEWITHICSSGYLYNKNYC